MPLPAAGGDDGAPDPRLAAAVAGSDGSAAAEGELLAALAGARVFLALAAEALATEQSTVPGLRQESAAQMSLLSVVSSSGARALPAFLDGHQVQRWRPEARPVPAAGPLACQAVLEDGAQALLLDPLGAAVAVSGEPLSELAAGRVPVAGAALSTRRGQVELGEGPPAPPALLEALSRALAPEGLAAARLLRGPDGPVLAVTPREALPAHELAAFAARVQGRLGADLPREGLDLAVLPDGEQGQRVVLPRPSRPQGGAPQGGAPELGAPERGRLAPGLLARGLLRRRR